MIRPLQLSRASQRADVLAELARGGAGVAAGAPYPPPGATLPHNSEPPPSATSAVQKWRQHPLRTTADHSTP
eukprot:8625778-Pyramimonas_sp.AAC.2